MENRRAQALPSDSTALRGCQPCSCLRWPAILRGCMGKNRRHSHDAAGNFLSRRGSGKAEILEGLQTSTGLEHRTPLLVLHTIYPQVTLIS